MKSVKTLILALSISFMTSGVYAAPSASWGKTQTLHGVEEKLDAKQYQAAIDELKTIVAKDSKNADAYNLLGFSNRKLKNYDTAEDYYQQALTLKPDHKGALEYLGELYVETDRLDNAQQMLERLDKACLLGCKEYKQLKTMIERKKLGLPTETKW